MKRINKEFSKEVGIRLKTVREALDKTQKQLASHFGILPNSYSKYESGQLLVGTDGMLALSREFNVSLDWLIAGKGPMFYDTKTPPPSVPEPPKEEQAALTGDLGTDVKALIRHMEQAPMLRHELMSFMYRFKSEHPKLFAESEGESE